MQRGKLDAQTIPLFLMSFMIFGVGPKLGRVLLAG